jgi:hypothetical protein
VTNTAGRIRFVCRTFIRCMTAPCRLLDLDDNVAGQVETPAVRGLELTQRGRQPPAGRERRRASAEMIV